MAQTEIECISATLCQSLPACSCQSGEVWVVEIALQYFSRCANDGCANIEKRLHHKGSNAAVAPGHQYNLVLHRVPRSRWPSDSDQVDGLRSPDTPTFAYMIVHEADHRGQLRMLAQSMGNGCRTGPLTESGAGGNSGGSAASALHRKARRYDNPCH
jgi:hypothetical protein